MSLNVENTGTNGTHHLDDAHPAAILAPFTQSARSSDIAEDYLNVLRHGAPGTRIRLIIHKLPVTVTLAAPLGAEGGRDQELRSWRDLRAAVAAAHHTGIHPELPQEVAAITVTRDGHRVHIARAGTPACLLRRARKVVQRRWSALSPLPALCALTEPLAGSATAVGIAVAPVLPPIHPGTPPPAHVREMTGQYAGTSGYVPGTFNLPGHPVWAAPTPPLLPAPTAAAAADHETVVPDRQPRVMPSAPSTPSTPSGEASTPAVEVPVSVEPSPTVTGDGSGALVDPTAPVEQPTDTPTNAVTTEAAMSPTPTVSPLRRLLQPHHRHKRHPRHGLHGHR